MNKNSGQIFQTNSVTRWRSFKWTFRVLLIIALFLIIVLIIALKTGVSPSAVNIQNRGRAYQNTLDTANPLAFSTSQNKKYKGFKSFLFKRIKEDSLRHIASLQQGTTPELPFIRAGFYTP